MGDFTVTKVMNGFMVDLAYQYNINSGRAIAPQDELLVFETTENLLNWIDEYYKKTE